MRRIAAGLLVVGAFLLLFGVSNESTGENASHASSESTQGHLETRSESSETAAASDESHTESTVLGVNTESNAAVATVLAISVLLAALVVLVEARAVVAAVAVFALAFTVFDIAEVVHQIDVSESGLAVLAVVVALAHLGAGGLAAALTRPAARQARAD
jgi:hypothetical protein